jgi:hypothetical protein
MSSNPLVGTWRLLSWENRTLDGEVSHPLGGDASGYIAYTEDGYVFVAIMGAARRPCASLNRPRNSRPAQRGESPARAGVSGVTRSTQTTGDLEKAGAAETYVSYCGRYEFHGDTVLHHVELSLFPNWLGVTQERLVKISGDQLTLSTLPLLLQGRQQTAHLLWERV